MNITQFDNPKDNRRTAGKRAKKSGDTFEKALRGIHHVYRMERKAIVQQLHKPTGGWGVGMYVKGTATLDFGGTLSGGRHVVIEAKSTSLIKGKTKGTLAIDTAYTLKPCSGIQFAQVEELQALAAMNVLCLIAWWNGERCGIFVVPADWKPTGVSMSREQFAWLEPGSYDWLSVVRKAVGA